MKKRITNLPEIVNCWCNLWKLIINNKKTTKINAKSKTETTYSINNTIITELHNGKFLEVTLDDKLTLDLHVNNINQ